MRGVQASSEPFPPPNVAPPGARYAGSASCAKCHVEAQAQPATPMGHAMETVADCAILRQHPRLTFRTGSYRYEIVRKGEASLYTVSDGQRSISLPVLYALGVGDAGQTYVVNYQHTYYESRVSFFNDTQSLDFTLGAARSIPTSLEDAIGRPMTKADTALCFGCHSTGAVAADRVDFKRLVPGVGCESCHGPGAEHIEAVASGHLDKLHVFNPGRLQPGDLADFCGACHRTWMQVELMHVGGVANVRFQPYRLTLSKCYDRDDPRISCLACHDPHKNVVREPATYDAACVACHASRPKPVATKTSGPTAAPCPVKQGRCVTCHMPKYSLPGAHFRFTDHRIREVHPGEPYPG
jgi:hypothetical protein